MGKRCYQAQTIAVLLFGLCLIALNAAASDAQDTGVASPGRFDIQVTLGFSDRFRLNRWTPVTVSVSNRGADLLGQLAVETTGGNELLGELFTLSYRRDIGLSGGTRKKFYFTVLLDNPARPLQVRIIENGRELARRSIDLRNRFSTGPLVLVLSRDADLDYLNDSSGEALRVLYPHPGLLPEHWQGYDGVAAMVLHGVSLEHLNAKQFESLKRWVSGGGVLAISGGPDYALLRTPRLAELVPGTPVAMAQISADAALSGSLPGVGDWPAPFDINRLANFRGRVLYRADEHPLIIEQDRGRGRILYLTFDVARLPFADWPDMKRLWLQSLRLAPLQPFSNAVLSRQKTSNGVLSRQKTSNGVLSRQNTGLYSVDNQSAALSPVPAIIRKDAKGFPRHTTVFVFLALYLGLLLTGYRLLSAGIGKQPVLAWLTWTSPLVFAPVAYLLFGPLFFPKGASAVMLSTIEPLPPGPYAYLHVDLGIYAKQKTRLRLDYEGAEPVFRPARWDAPVPAKRTRSWVFYENPQRSLQPEDQREYVLHLLAGQDIIAYDLAGSVEKTQNELRLSLRNNSGRMLHSALFVFEESIYPLGAVSDDATLRRSFSPDTDAGRPRYGQQLLRKALDADRLIGESLLNRVYDTIREAQQQAGGDALFIGFSSSPLRLSGTAVPWRSDELALVLMRLPVTEPALVREDTGDGTD